MVTKQLNYRVAEETKTNVDKLAKTLGIKQGKLLDTIVAEYFSKRTFTNDFIELPEPLYISYDAILYPEVEYEGLSVVSRKLNYLKNTTEADNILVITKVCNNLDSWNSKYNAYCYRNKSEKHKGVIPFYNGTEEIICKPGVICKGEEFTTPEGEVKIATKNIYIDLEYIEGLSLLEIVYNSRTNEAILKYHKDIDNYIILNSLPEEATALIEDTKNYVCNVYEKRELAINKDIYNASPIITPEITNTEWFRFINGRNGIIYYKQYLKNKNKVL